MMVLTCTRTLKSISSSSSGFCYRGVLMRVVPLHGSRMFATITPYGWVVKAQVVVP